jgi:hypothetical protein
VAAIKALVAAEYPEPPYRYLVERALTGTRLFPDLQVLDDEGSIQAVVEIGYTRPEKLTAYRQTYHIPDVRWYDKSGRLHTDHETIQRRVVTDVEIALHPAGPFSLYLVWEYASCEACPETATGITMARLWRVCHRFVRRFGDHAYEALMTFAEQECAQAVFTAILTDGVKFFLPSTCDKCGRNFFADDENARDLYWTVMDSGQALGRIVGARHAVLSEADARAYLKDTFDLSWQYEEDGDWFEAINTDHARRQIAIIRRHAVKEAALR